MGSAYGDWSTIEEQRFCKTFHWNNGMEIVWVFLLPSLCSSCATDGVTINTKANVLYKIYKNQKYSLNKIKHILKYIIYLELTTDIQKLYDKKKKKKMQKSTKNEPSHDSYILMQEYYRTTKIQNNRTLRIILDITYWRDKFLINNSNENIFIFICYLNTHEKLAAAVLVPQIHSNHFCVVVSCLFVFVICFTLFQFWLFFERLNRKSHISRNHIYYLPFRMIIVMSKTLITIYYLIHSRTCNETPSLYSEHSQNTTKKINK